MTGFTPQPDEGYSEDPLTAASASSFSVKQREDAVSSLASSRTGDEFPPWLVQHISGLSMPRKTGKPFRCMPLLDPFFMSGFSPVFRAQNLPWPSSMTCQHP